MIKRPLTIVTVIALAALVLAACGGSDSTTTSSETAATTSSATGAGSTVKISADPGGDLSFTADQLTAPAGSDTIEFDNSSTTAHNVQIEDAGGNVVAGTDTITGDTTATTADLKPGTYTYFCGIPGHREAGMEGTLTVK